MMMQPQALFFAVRFTVILAILTIAAAVVPADAAYHNERNPEIRPILVAEANVTGGQTYANPCGKQKDAILANEAKFIGAMHRAKDNLAELANETDLQNDARAKAIINSAVNGIIGLIPSIGKPILFVKKTAEIGLEVSDVAHRVLAKEQKIIDAVGDKLKEHFKNNARIGGVITRRLNKISETLKSQTDRLAVRGYNLVAAYNDCKANPINTATPSTGLSLPVIVGGIGLIGGGIAIASSGGGGSDSAPNPVTASCASSHCSENDIDSPTQNFSVDGLIDGISNGLLCSELDALVTPIPLTTEQINNGRNPNSDNPDFTGVTGYRYNDDFGNIRILIEKLDWAHLGFWINGDITNNDFDYAFLGNNEVVPPTPTHNRGVARYGIIGDATYRGVNFFPTGNLYADFNEGNLSGRFAVGIGSADVADGNMGFSITDATINEFGFQGGSLSIHSTSFHPHFHPITGGYGEPTGFFSGLSPSAIGLTAINFGFSGIFTDGSSYNPEANVPSELVGVFEMTATNSFLPMDDRVFKMGFIGQCETNC